MSLFYCFECDEPIDTDFDVEHLDQCPDTEVPKWAHDPMWSKAQGKTLIDIAYPGIVDLPHRHSRGTDALESSETVTELLDLEPREWVNQAEEPPVRYNEYIDPYMRKRS
jgi:hypothetical protein